MGPSNGRSLSPPGGIDAQSSLIIRGTGGEDEAPVLHIKNAKCLGAPCSSSPPVLPSQKGLSPNCVKIAEWQQHWQRPEGFSLSRGRGAAISEPLPGNWYKVFGEGEFRMIGDMLFLLRGNQEVRCKLGLWESSGSSANASNLLVWPKRLFRFFHKMVWGN